jgi:fructokinase
MRRGSGGIDVRIGVDLGGTKIEAAALDNDGEIVARRRVATPTDDYDATIASIVELVDGLETDYDQQGSVGAGIPGAISPESGLVKNANSTCLIGHPLDQDLSEALKRPIRVANDANCFALSEAVDGAATDAASVFGVILGTGVGGGIVIGGSLLTGAQAIAGEWGHNPMPGLLDEDWADRRCYCGRLNCIETFLSGPALAADHARRTGGELTSEEIADLAKSGDKAARDSVERYAERLGRALATVVNVIDPDVIVLGGGVSNIAALYELVPPQLAKHVFSDTCHTTVVRAHHGGSSGVRGAAWLWRPDEVKSALPR